MGGSPGTREVYSFRKVVQHDGHQGRRAPHPWGGGGIQKLGGWEDPAAVEGGKNPFSTCCLLSGEWVFEDPFSKMLMVFQIDHRRRDTLSKKWSLFEETLMKGKFSAPSISNGSAGGTTETPGTVDTGATGSAAVTIEKVFPKRPHGGPPRRSKPAGIASDPIDDVQLQALVTYPKVRPPAKRKAASGLPAVEPKTTAANKVKAASGLPAVEPRHGSPALATGDAAKSVTDLWKKAKKAKNLFKNVVDEDTRFCQRDDSRAAEYVRAKTSPIYAGHIERIKNFEAALCEFGRDLLLNTAKTMKSRFAEHN